MTFFFMPVKGTNDAVFNLRRLQQKHFVKKKKNLHFVEKASDSTK